jgi:hypothetical protein
MIELSGAISLQERDINILRGLFESRIMTTAHITSLYFDGRREGAKKRLQKLKSAGFITERRYRVFSPAALFLSSKGLRVLKDTGVLTEYPKIALPLLEKRSRVSELTVRHELEVQDVKVAFHSSIRNHPQLKITEFITWPALCQFEASCAEFGGGHRMLIKPDGFIRIHENEADGGLSEHAFFLEVDRSTEVLETLTKRALAYVDHYKSGGFAERNGGDYDSIKDFPFRTLITLQSQERRNNVAEQLLHLNPPILTQICLTTIAELKNDPFGSIWVRPVDYRQAMQNSPFDPNRARKPLGYRRQTERELFVEQRVQKRPLIED